MKNRKLRRTLAMIVAFVCLGITMEVIWTGILNAFTGDKSATGETYLWMIPIYAITPWFFELIGRHGPDSWWKRGLLYMFTFTAWEYITGGTLRLIIGFCPWDYSGRTLNLYFTEFNSDINGLVLLQYFPLWFCVGLAGEKIYKYLYPRFS